VTWLVASDWHLSPRSPALHGRLAVAFLAQVRASEARLVLAGDVFEALFDRPGRAEGAHPAVVAALAALAAEGRLTRLAGNHDPAAGDARTVLDVDGIGRVLVAHGHAQDPVSASALGRLGDAVSRRLGHLAAVRGAARAVEVAARRLASERMVAVFRARWLAEVERGGFDLGVFGHVHVAHLAVGDRYANAGALDGERLSYLALDRAGPRLEAFVTGGHSPR
jgi:UDP-2,3-diacylglucosamine pyrophosphatase LpxH